MPKETLLDSRIHEVMRALPSVQTNEIKYQDSALYSAAQHIEYGVLYHSVKSVPGERRSASLLNSYIPKLASQLVWDDLLLAEQHGFPALSPTRAMYLGRTATNAANTIQVVAPTIEVEEFMSLASGIVGLHGAIIGSEEVLMANQDTQATLTRAVEALRDNFVNRLYVSKRNQY